MNIKVKAFGEGLETNCYILDFGEFEFIIDPGIGATSWVKENVKNPKAILNTHAHYDHIWSVEEIKTHFNIPFYIHKDDNFLAQMNQGMNNPTSKADVEVSEENIKVEGIDIKFIHVPGHTPGLCMIEIGDDVFSGDFIFANGSIGRFDFPYSDAKQMKESLKKFMLIPYDKTVYPGHGPKTTIKKEQENLKRMYPWV